MNVDKAGARRILAFCAGAAVVFTVGAQAQPGGPPVTPDLSGTSWSGPMTGGFDGTSGGCDYSGPAAGTLSIDFGSMNNSQQYPFSGSALFQGEASGESARLQGLAAYDELGFLFGSLQAINLLDEQNVSPVEFYGLITQEPGGTAYLMNLGISDTGSDCPFEGGASLMNYASGGVVDPEVAAVTQVIAEQVLLNDVRTFLNTQSSRVVGFLRGLRTGGFVGPDGFMLDNAGTGLAAGDVFGMPLGMWVSYARSEYEDDFARTAFDASRDQVVAGVDVSPLESLLVGVALGWDSARAKTFFNAGESDTNTLTVSPYLAVLLGEVFSLDVSFGYSALETDQSSGNGAGGSMDSDRWFWAGNLNLGQQFGAWYVAGRVGLLNAREYQDAFTFGGVQVAERTVKLGQWRIGGDVSYLLGAFEPYVTATYEQDYARTDLVLTPGAQPANDRNGVVAGAGVRYYGTRGVTGSLEWLTVQGRQDYSEDTFSLLLRVDL